MRYSTLFTFLALPVLSVAQLTTSVFSTVSVNSNRQETTIVSSTVFSIGSASSSPAATGSSGSSGNSSGGNSTSSTPTTLPTAASTVAGANGDGPNGGAPSPGASGAGGIYGPPDGYIAGASTLQINGLIIGLAGVAAGASLILA
ncbi:hypothetical protein CONPUDRAFT_134072 [Coniophora puteana RWD-64-598 SS2]|uniref:Uncharacterized protein n=1 Tax=Coniophora puteana (strain RWD-64-598) TaxID=741705 RepID=A0A5M3N747_CONPW|nr:uncharacterized protein CONPUDRAFT_134072 [Coniophora puteana RWD-64-598 SS2]EIW86681.1 hypothetical protein CONPUDRAFT_134072 [Coniophora puteana RWD-64-598 SS2]